MPSSAKLHASFDSITALIDGDGGPSGFREMDTETACAELEATLVNTVLPRRITIRSEDGVRLSVIARNRRVIKVADVHPQNLWEGQQSPQATVCEGDYDSFARAFTSVLLKIVADKRIIIEQTFLPHALGTITHSGYPASMLCDHVSLSQNDEGDAAVIQGFYDTFPDHPRARFGSADEIDIPATSNIDPAWIDGCVAALREELNGKDTDLRFIVVDGGDCRGAAMAWLGGEGCLVMSEYPDQFDELELRLSALRERL